MRKIKVAKTTSSKDAAPVDTFKYRVNKRYRIFPMTGIAYTTNSFQDVASSSDGASAGKVTQEQQTHFIIGLKVFFNKTDIRSNKFFLGNDAYGKSVVLTRLHFDAAVDIVSPLRNIYTGLGLDLGPGVSLNGGAVFNKYNYNLYSNGQNTIIKTLYGTGAYIGLTTDVSVVADLFKLLNISK
ncbi:hypothetical protein [Mucilaginibacter sp. 3215]|uniref:hypothetical protein n=1 Tax=Mucilaginibacter sp. 3215 TaxID=3373912 RepID=UPI003D1FB074